MSNLMRHEMTHNNPASRFELQFRVLVSQLFGNHFSTFVEHGDHAAAHLRSRPNGLTGDKLSGRVD